MYGADELRVLLQRWERGLYLGPYEMEALLAWDETPKAEHAELRVLIEEHWTGVEPGEGLRARNRFPKSLPRLLHGRLRSVFTRR
jgi:hypothetical protein